MRPFAETSSILREDGGSDHGVKPRGLADPHCCWRFIPSTRDSLPAGLFSEEPKAWSASPSDRRDNRFP